MTNLFKYVPGLKEIAVIKKRLDEENRKLHENLSVNGKVLRTLKPQGTKH